MQTEARFSSSNWGARLTRMVLLGVRSDLFRIDVIADGKHELKPFPLRGRCSNRAKDVGQAVHKCSHRRINDRLSGQSLPWEIDIDAAATIVERPGMVELRWPMRTFEVKFPRTLCDPGQLRDRGGRVLPVHTETAAVSTGLTAGTGGA